MLKLGLCKKSRSEHVVRIVLQAFNKASKKKGLKLPIASIQFLDTMRGDRFIEHEENGNLEECLAEISNDLNNRWNRQ